MDVQAEVRRIEKALKRRGIPVARFLEAAGVDASRWQRYKKGLSEPRLTNWTKITSTADRLALAPPSMTAGNVEAAA